MLHDDFSRWLQTATHGLPKNALPMIQAELRAHYEDALEDYVRVGKPIDEAQHAALADLGDAQDTSRALKQIHLAPRRYLLAGIASIAPWLMLISFVPLISISVMFTALLLPFYVLSFLCTLYVLHTFRTLLPYHRLSLPITFISVGISGVMAGLLLTAFGLGILSVFGNWSFFYLNEPIIGYTFASMTTSIEASANVIIMCSMLLTALGSILFGRRIIPTTDRLHQMVALTFILHGICLFLQMTAVLAHNETAAGQCALIAVFAVVAKYAGCALLYFRAARIGSPFPTQTT
jgi:hypothetical protein